MRRPRLSLLGGLDFAGDGADSPAFTRKARALLAYLALQSRHSQSREKLAALLWGNNGESQARVNLRQALSAIRRVMPASKGEWLRTEGDRIFLDLEYFDFDVAQFEALAAGSASEELEKAIALYRGDLLDGFSLNEEPFEDWLRLERERLRAIAVMAMDKLLARYLETSQLAEFAQAATRLLALEPLREDIHQALMRTYAAQGRFNLALQQYERCRDLLQRQLGLQPAPATRALYEELRARRMRSSHAVAQAPSGGVAPDASAPAGHARPGTHTGRPATRYVKSGGVNIAYQVTGDGPIDLIYVPGWVSNLDYAWESPRLAHVLDRLGSFCRLIRVDKRGTGLSDRNGGVATLEDRMIDVRAVLDKVGSQRTVLFGSSEGGLMCMLFAASYPERTAALILHGAYARGSWAEDYPWGSTSQETEEDIALVERDWGEPADLSRAAPSLMHDLREREWFAGNLRNSASPAEAIALWRWSTAIDARNILPAIRVPTLIIHRTGDKWVNVEQGRYLARHIRGARYVELPGDDHLLWGADSDRLVDTIEAFLVSTTPHGESQTALLTVMHMEAAATTAGSDGRQRLLHGDETSRALQRAGGWEIGRTERGIVAAFQQPTRAIRCVLDERDRVAGLGVTLRAAVHIGECEKLGDKVEGAAVRLSSMLVDHARPGEVVASRTVRDLVLGSDLVFELRGEVEVEASGPWQLFAISSPAAALAPKS